MRRNIWSRAQRERFDRRD